MSKISSLLTTLFESKGGNEKLWYSINDILLEKSNESKSFCSFMKIKLRDMNKDTQLLALDFLDFSMDNAKMPLWTCVSSKDFLSSLVNIIKTRDVPEVHSKILYLIKKWGKKYEKYKNIIPNFTDMYNHLKDSGMTFPQNEKSTYYKYINEQNNNCNYDSDDNDDNDDNSNTGDNYLDSLNIDLDPSNYEKKYKKLIEKLNEWIEDVGKANELIDKNKINKKLKDIMNELNSGFGRLNDTVNGNKLKDETLMEITLNAIDDINKTVKRYESAKSGRKVDKFISSFKGEKKENDEEDEDGRCNNYNNNFGGEGNANNNINNNQHQDLLDLFNDSSNNNMDIGMGNNMNMNNMNMGMGNNMNMFNMNMGNNNNMNMNNMNMNMGNNTSANNNTVDLFGIFGNSQPTNNNIANNNQGFGMNNMNMGMNMGMTNNMNMNNNTMNNNNLGFNNMTNNNNFGVNNMNFGVSEPSITDFTNPQTNKLNMLNQQLNMAYNNNNSNTIDISNNKNLNTGFNNNMMPNNNNVMNMNTGMNSNMGNNNTNYFNNLF